MLQILFEDDVLIVVNKSPGELSVPGKNSAFISTAEKVEQYLQAPAYVVHRLDCATSGVMMFAKTAKAQSHLHRSFQNRWVSKIYHALLCTPPTQQQGTIDLPLMGDWPARPKQKVDEAGKAALTTWVLQPDTEIQNINFARVELRPKTGRTHQLRVHMAAIGHPILGDRLYAAEEFQSKPDGSGQFARLYLHASVIYLRHPQTLNSVSFNASCNF